MSKFLPFLVFLTHVLRNVVNAALQSENAKAQEVSRHMLERSYWKYYYENPKETGEAVFNACDKNNSDERLQILREFHLNNHFEKIEKSLHRVVNIPGFSKTSLGNLFTKLDKNMVGRRCEMVALALDVVQEDTLHYIPQKALIIEILLHLADEKTSVVELMVVPNERGDYYLLKRNKVKNSSLSSVPHDEAALVGYLKASSALKKNVELYYTKEFIQNKVYNEALRLPFKNEYESTHPLIQKIRDIIHDSEFNFKKSGDARMKESFLSKYLLNWQRKSKVKNTPMPVLLPKIKS